MNKKLLLLTILVTICLSMIIRFTIEPIPQINSLAINPIIGLKTLQTTSVTGTFNSHWISHIVNVVFYFYILRKFKLMKKWQIATICCGLISLTVIIINVYSQIQIALQGESGTSLLIILPLIIFNWAWCSFFPSAYLMMKLFHIPII